MTKHRITIKSGKLLLNIFTHLPLSKTLTIIILLISRKRVTNLDQTLNQSYWISKTSPKLHLLNKLTTMKLWIKLLLYIQYFQSKGLDRTKVTSVSYFILLHSNKKWIYKTMKISYLKVWNLLLKAILVLMTRLGHRMSRSLQITKSSLITYSRFRSSMLLKSGWRYHLRRVGKQGINPEISFPLIVREVFPKVFRKRDLIIALTRS